jgi:MFS transporter, DHA1 family, tetracycline resistance protein
MSSNNSSSNKHLLPIFLVVFVDLLGFSIILPLLPYYAKSLQVSDHVIGLLVASYSICQFVAAPLLGDLSDRFGRRPLMIYSQLGSLAGFLLLGTALHLPNPLFWIFISRIIDGISGGNITIAQAYVADITKPEERAKSYGLIGVAFGLGFLVGPALGGTLSTYGYDIPAYTAAFFSLMSVLGTIFFLPEPARHTESDKRGGLRIYLRVFEYFQFAELRRLLMIFFFFVLPFALYVSMFSLYAYHQLNFTAQQTGYFLALAGLLGVIWQGGVIGPLVKRLGERRALLIGLASSVIGLFTIAIVDVWWKLIFVAIFFSFGTGVTRPSITSLITQAAPPERRGGVLGVTSSIESFSRIIGPLMGGWIIGALHPTWMGLVGGALALIAVMLALTARYESKNFQSQARDL